MPFQYEIISGIGSRHLSNSKMPKNEKQVNDFEHTTQEVNFF